jgi:hypothetical protein
MRHSFLRQLIREMLLIEAVAPKWIENLIMSTDMADIASDVDPTTGRSGLDYFVEDNAKFIRSLEDEHGAGSAPIKFIGDGFQGTVWQLPDGNVMKLASDSDVEKRVYKQYLTKMKMQHAGDTASVGDLRILDVFPITWRYPKDVGDPHVPEHGEVAVIMDKVVPLDKSKELEDSMNVILVSIMLTLSRMCVPYLKEEYQDDAMAYLSTNPSDIDTIRLNVPLPWDLRNGQWTKYSTSMKEDIDKRAALSKIAQDFLRSVDDELSPASRAKIGALPEIVGSYFSIRLNPKWWTRLKNAIAQEARQGNSDIKADNFGIDSKGDIIPFDL